MNKVSRRTFLTGTAATAIAAVCGVRAQPSSSAPLVLYGDGVHVDTDALNALFSGRLVVSNNERLQMEPGKPVYLRGGVYKIRSHIEMRVPCTVEDIVLDGAGISLNCP